MTKRIKHKGININILKTTKFKSTRIHISFGSELNKDTVTERAILPYLLRAETKKYPSKMHINDYLENLYAAQFSVGTTKMGKTHFVQFDMSVIDDMYTINNENLFEEALLFLKEIIFNPVFSDDAFKEEYRLMEEYFLGLYANKMRLAVRELIQTMFENESFSINPLGDLESLKTLTIDNVKKVYQDMLLNDQVNISIVGNFDIDNTLELVNKHLYFDERDINLEFIDSETKEITKENTKTIIQEVTQSKVAIGYRFNVRYLDKQYYPAIIFNALLGGTSDSLLHQKIREELGLVYFVGSSYSIFKGAMFIHLGLNQSEYDNAIKEIDKVITSVIEGDFDLERVEIAKKSILSDIIESYDSNYSLVKKIESQTLFNRDVPLEKVKEMIENVKLDDIKEVAKLLIKDTTVLLRGQSNEEN